MRNLFLLALISTGTWAAQFCHVSDSGYEKCHYSSMYYCQLAVSNEGGVCIVKSDGNANRGFNVDSWGQGGFGNKEQEPLQCWRNAWGEVRCN